MATTSRVIVVLRSELGTQLSLAQNAVDNFAKLYQDGKIDSSIPLEDFYKNEREMQRARRSVERLKKAIEALGALQLGDIEDKDNLI